MEEGECSGGNRTQNTTELCDNQSDELQTPAPCIDDDHFEGNPGPVVSQKRYIGLLSQFIQYSYFESETLFSYYG